ncbi:hypothetical protein G6F68_012089 [Rhizopus microsporus]|nr:hypothetical protein G6F68_012089 [Rhizopus microsporus]
MGRHRHREGRGDRTRQQAQPQVRRQVEQAAQHPGADAGDQAAHRHPSHQHRPVAPDQHALLVQRQGEGHDDRPQHRHQPMRAGHVVPIPGVQEDRQGQQQRGRHDQGRCPPVRMASVEQARTDVGHDPEIDGQRGAGHDQCCAQQDDDQQLHAQHPQELAVVQQRHDGGHEEQQHFAQQPARAAMDVAHTQPPRRQQRQY